MYEDNLARKVLENLDTDLEHALTQAETLEAQPATPDTELELAKRYFEIAYLSELSARREAQAGRLDAAMKLRRQAEDHLKFSDAQFGEVKEQLRQDPTFLGQYNAFCAAIGRETESEFVLRTAEPAKKGWLETVLDFMWNDTPPPQGCIATSTNSYRAALEVIDRQGGDVRRIVGNAGLTHDLSRAVFDAVENGLRVYTADDYDYLSVEQEEATFNPNDHPAQYTDFIARVKEQGGLKSGKLTPDEEAQFREEALNKGKWDFTPQWAVQAYAQWGEIDAELKVRALLGEDTSRLRQMVETQFEMQYGASPKEIEEMATEGVEIPLSARDRTYGTTDQRKRFYFYTKILEGLRGQLPNVDERMSGKLGFLPPPVDYDKALREVAFVFPAIQEVHEALPRIAERIEALGFDTVMNGLRLALTKAEEASGERRLYALDDALRTLAEGKPVGYIAQDHSK